MTAEIAALHINEQRTHAILAGREILETVRINGTNCSEDLNIREALYKHDRYNATRNRDNLDIHDVKWSTGNFSSFIACAATNGKVVIYDLARPGIEASRLHEHHRQVHRVAFSPFQGALLLSASHDGTVRLWDLRDMRSEVTTINSRAKFSGQSEGVRDVRWSPTDILEFALGTDSGVVQRWDHRNPKAAKLKINAHEAGCTSVDWHPDGKHLLSAGQDRTSGNRSYGVLKIWDFSSDHKRQKPTRSLRTPYSISNARWRPPCWSGDELGRGSWQATQVLTAYDEKHPVVHLWDFRRPHIPFREVYTSRTAPTDMLWHSIDVLWSVGREGEFHQTDIKYAPKTIDRRPLSTFAISPTGEMVAFGQKRSRRRYSDLELSLQGAAKPSALRVMPKPSIPELGRSSVDDSIDDTFLSSSYQPRHHERSLSNRSTKSLASTPPSLDKDSLLKFDFALEQVKDSSLPQQTALRGPLPGTGNINAFSFLAQKYKSQPLPDEPTVEDFHNVTRSFDQNANYASRTGLHRTAQAWKDVGALLQQEVSANGEQRRRARLSHDGEIVDPYLELPSVAMPTHEEELIAAHVTDSTLMVGNGDGHLTESDSNMPTPLARPHTSTHNAHVSSQPRSIPEPPHDDQLSLPPSVVSGGSAGFPKAMQTPSNPVAKRRRPTLDEPSTWFSTNDINERRAQMTNWRAQPKAPLDLDTPSKEPPSKAMPIPPPMDRHNSDESFSMFPSSSESKAGLSLSQSISSLRERKPSMSSIPEDLQQDDDEKYEKFPQDYSGSTSFSLPNENGSQSGSSKGDVFNGSFDSLQLSESPHGTRSLVPDPFPASSHKAFTPNKAAPKRTGIPRPDKLLRSHTAAPAVQPLPKNDSKELILEDFQKPPGLSLERTYPISAGKMLQQSFTYHTALVPDAQQIFHLTALLKPFLPHSAGIAVHESERIGTARLEETQHILEEYAHYCKVELNLELEEIYLILTDHLAHLARFRIHPLQVEAIFTAYQEQLERCMLFTPSTVLRNLLYPSFGAFRDHLLENSGIGLVCLKCNKPVNATTGKCEKCQKRHDPCPICWQRFSPYVLTKRAKKVNEAMVPAIRIGANGRFEKVPTPASILSVPPPAPEQPLLEVEDVAVSAPDPPTLWQFCLSCGHGSHAACLQNQQKQVPELGGRCPTAGCGCPCIPGLYRDQTIKKAEEEKARKSVGSVKGDGRRIKESGAVKGARGLLGLEEGKRVRVVEPERR